MKNDGNDLVNEGRGLPKSPTERKGNTQKEKQMILACGQYKNKTNRPIAYNRITSCATGILRITKQILPGWDMGGNMLSQRNPSEKLKAS